MSILAELQPGALWMIWFVGLGLAVTFLYRSMRKQIGKISIPKNSRDS